MKRDIDDIMYELANYTAEQIEKAVKERLVDKKSLEVFRQEINETLTNCCYLKDNIEANEVETIIIAILTKSLNTILLECQKTENSN